MMRRSIWMPGAALLVALVLGLGSVVGALVALQERAEALRGWVDATETRDVPHRLPLAGINVALTQYDDAQLARELARMAEAGFTWVRQPFLWQEIEPDPGVFQWDAYDRIVAAVDATPGLELVALLDGTPAWARHHLAPQHPFAPPASVSAYGAFAGAVASRYADSLTQYQIWDEPNINEHWGQLDPRPAHYVAMLREAYTAIHAVDPSASVIMAALAPTVETGPENLNEVLYLRAVYEQDGAGFFDAAAGKPYGFDAGPYDRRVADSIMNFSRLILMREEMVRQGDGDKPLWGSNFGWNYLPDDWSGPPSIWGSATAAQQMGYTFDAYARARREWPWLGGLIVQHWDPDAPVDDPVQGFALRPVLDDWLAHGDFASGAVMGPGRYPAQNPFTTYTENWQFSDLGADAQVPPPEIDPATVENRITVQFEGTAFALELRRDDYLAYLHVTIDGEPANALPRNRQGDAFIVLTSPERTPQIDLILAADGLEPGSHTAEIVHLPARGDDRWPIVGFAVAAPRDTSATDRALLICGVVGGLALVVGAVATWRFPWRRMRPPRPDALRRGMEWLTGLLTSFLVLIGTLLTWGDAFPALLRRDPPALAITILTAGIASLAPVFLITLLALGVLFVLILNRPLLGVMLVIFWSAFFLSSLDLFFRLFATVEVYLLLTVVAVVARSLIDWARLRRGKPAQPAIERIRVSRLDWLVMAFAGLAVISLAWAELRGTALRELRVVVLEPVLFYFLLRAMRLDRRDVVWLVDTLLFAGGAIAVVGLVLFATGENVVEAEDGARRLISIYGSPNGVGLYLGRCLPFAMAYALLLPRGSYRQMYGAAGVAVMALAVLLSQSRGAILLGIPAALVAMLLVWRGRRAWWPIVGALAGLAALLVPLSLVLPRLRDLLGDTAIFRRNLWESSLKLIQERPLTGVGLDQFLYWYRSRYLLPEAWEEPNLAVPHNLVLNHWVSLGILGVILLVLFQAAYWHWLWRLRGRVVVPDAATRMTVRDPLLLALVVGLGGSMAHLVAHGLVDVGYFAVNLAFFFMWLLALLHRVDALSTSFAPKAD